MRIEGNNYGYKPIKEGHDQTSREERIAKLKKQIADDTFHPDPNRVARKILGSPEARRDLGFDVKV